MLYDESYGNNKVIGKILYNKKKVHGLLWLRYGYLIH
jgi:hypothetical protein